MQIEMRWEGNGLARMTHALEGLAEGRAVKGLRRALNHTGNKVYTRVRRRIAEHTRVPVRMIDQYGALRRRPASDGSLEFRIRATGKGIPLRHFGARQTRRGVSVSVWPKGRYLIPGAFLVAKAGGNVFWREGKARLPIEKLSGPSIPKELVKPYVDQTFQAMVAMELPPRVEHEVRVMTNGVVS